MERGSVYDVVTSRLLEIIETSGKLPWEVPWKRMEDGFGARNVVSKKAYRGVNQILLSMMPYEAPLWGTFRQITKLGGMVKKGARGFPIVYWHSAEQALTEKREGGEKVVSGRKFLRYYTVFNVEQTEGIQYEVPKVRELAAGEGISRCERIWKGFRSGPRVRFGCDEACYIGEADLVMMPCREAFSREEDFYLTLFHEIIHATGHRTRLAREGVTSKAKENFYARYGREELIAELGGAFLASHGGISKQSERESAAYLQFWKAAIQADKTLFIRAASEAEKASDYVLSDGKQSEDEMELLAAA